MKNFLHIFLIFTFVLAGISPACKFISGQTQQVEICSYDGIKMITVAHNEAPDDQEQDHKASQDCAFCFAQSNLKLAKALPPAFTPIENVSSTSVFTLTVLNLMRHETAASPRGPPYLVS